LVSGIISWLASLIISVISSTGYFGVFFLMLLESACIPIPSEIIMPFSGFLVWEGRFVLWQIVLWGALGNLAGSVLAYWIGARGGRPLMEKYGKYILISRRDLELADKWFFKYGQSAVFFSRLLPAVRTFISLPAGIARMDFKKFCFYTFLGALPWSYFLAYAGLAMGENWSGLRIYFEKFDYIILGLAFIGIIWWIWRHVRLQTINHKQ
jgi:membrane protein DedA with SNARE-associated domain